VGQRDLTPQRVCALQQFNVHHPLSGNPGSHWVRAVANRRVRLSQKTNRRRRPVWHRDIPADKKPDRKTSDTYDARPAFAVRATPDAFARSGVDIVTNRDRSV
jgi:hypothetical protein